MTCACFIYVTHRTLRFIAAAREPRAPRNMTFTGTIGKLCMFPLRAIIRICVALGSHPNTLTLIGVLINCAAGLGARARTASCWPASS